MENSEEGSELKGEVEDVHSKFLTFFLGGVEYGVNITHVVEIVRIQQITSLPVPSSNVCGIINLRGSVIPVVDLRSRFSLPEREHDDRTSIIIVNLDRTAVGLICDEVAEVVDMDSSTIDPLPSLAADGVQDCIEGIRRCENGDVVILLDIYMVLDWRAIEAEVM